MTPRRQYAGVGFICVNMAVALWTATPGGQEIEAMDLRLAFLARRPAPTPLFFLALLPYLFYN